MIVVSNTAPILSLYIKKNKGLITDIKTPLDSLIANGIWISKDLYRSVLQNNRE